MCFIQRKPIPNGEPCEHPGCLRHVWHPCEGCGRIAGYSLPNLPEGWRQYFTRLEEVARLLVEAKESTAKDTDARVEMTATQSLMLNDAYIIAKGVHMTQQPVP